MPEPDFGDLDTRGFVLVPGFLSEEELRVCRDDYASQAVDSNNRNYALSPVTGDAHEAVKRRVDEIIPAVRRCTSLRVDLPLGGVYFAIARGIRPLWHQDHESFYEVQNHHDYLNFYLPVVKPRPDRSNLCIVPFDVLEKESPRTFRRVVGGGATSYRPLKDRTMVFLEDTGAVHLMNRNINRLAHVPQLNAGDLLLLRGDMIHSPQDTATERVALSFRASRSDTTVRRSRLADGGPVKALMMMKNPLTYERMFRAFDVAGRGALGYAELKRIMEGLPPSESMGRKRFLRYLMRQKKRERVLWRFVPRTFAITLAGLAVAAAGRPMVENAP
jgi:hypothetical protein